MPKDKTLHAVILDPKSKEYQDVLKSFEATMRQSKFTLQQFPTMPAYYPKSTYNSIVQIQRIQNRVLYSQYAARKKVMEDNNLAGYQVERKLFHGTKPETCPKVNEQGFNRSFAGANGETYNNLSRPLCVSV